MTMSREVKQRMNSKRDSDCPISAFILPALLRKALQAGFHPSALSSSFTLIEVLVTLVILSTGIILVLRAFETSLVALGESRDSMRAGILLRETLADAEQQVLAQGEHGLDAVGRFFDAHDDWRVRVEVELDTVVQSANVTNKLYRVAALAWREGVDRRYGAATYLRTAE